MKWFRQYEELLRLRYKRLYGEQEADVAARREARKMAILGILASLILAAAVINDHASYKESYENVRLDGAGNISSVIRPDAGEGTYSFSTRAVIHTADGDLVKEYYITIEPKGTGRGTEQDFSPAPEDKREAADKQLKMMISNLNSDPTKAVIKMPDEMEDGTKVTWSRVENTDQVFYFIAFSVVIWMIYRNRFQGIKQEERRARDSIIRELPEFINKLVLLINAGVVFNSALIMISEEYRGRGNYFYERMKNISVLVRETNASFHRELYEFAKFSGVKELMRITNIMIDNVSKGDDLSDKLRRENELLWFARKQMAEERGRLAETKLTVPLMLLLMVLIIITIAPALMEM